MEILQKKNLSIWGHCSKEVGSLKNHKLFFKNLVWTYLDEEGGSKLVSEMYNHQIVMHSLNSN